MWLKYPEHTPAESGYYLTHYFNTEDQQAYFKCISYDKLSNRWIGWRANSGPDLSHVHAFVAETRHDFYTGCIERAESLEIGHYEPSN